MSHSVMTNKTSASLLKQNVKDSAVNIVKVNSGKPFADVLSHSDSTQLPVLNEPEFRENLRQLLQCQDLKQSFDIKKHKK